MLSGRAFPRLGSFRGSILEVPPASQQAAYVTEEGQTQPNPAKPQHLASRRNSHPNKGGGREEYEAEDRYPRHIKGRLPPRRVEEPPQDDRRPRAEEQHDYEETPHGP